MYSAFSDLVKDGGISAPAWLFFSTILVGIIGLFREVIITRHKVDNAHTAIDDVADSAKVAANNTHNVSNGFVARQDANFSALFTMVSRIDGKFDMLDRKLDAHIESSEEIIKLNGLTKGEDS